MDRLLRRVAALAVLAGALVAAGCEDSSASPAQRAEIERVVAGYLDALADSYSSLDTRPLEEWASPIEVATVRRILRSLVTTGDRVEATLRSYQLDRTEVFRGINATVWVIEVWDLVRYDAFSGVEKGRTDGSVQQTMLQLRKSEVGWQVIARSIVQEPTPTAGRSGSNG